MNVTPYQFALIGMPGKGKTMAFRNMNPETTGFVNMEKKPLPFINKFKHYSAPNTWQECYQKLIEYAKDSSIDVVILDSFSAYMDDLLKTAHETKRGFDIWNYFNEEVGKFLFLIKKFPKHIVVTAHYDWVEAESGAIEKRLSVPGGKWKGKVEKDFTVVHYTEMNIIDDKRNYYIILNSDGKTSGKTPPIFQENPESLENETMPNDYSVFIDRVNERLSK